MNAAWIGVAVLAAGLLLLALMYQDEALQEGAPQDGALREKPNNEEKPR
jgi:hypothetical protein